MSVEMKQRVNLTGAKLKPREIKEMLEGVAEFPPSRQDGGGMLILAERNSYIREAEPIGSIPLPLSKKGAVETVKGTVTGKQPLILTDKLGERLAFERTGTRLYQGFLGKVAIKDGMTGAISAGAVEQILQEEHEHFLLLNRAIEQLGGDPTAVTPAADIAAVMSLGLVQIMADPRTTLDQCLCVLLTAELADNDGWELLASLCEGLGHKDLGREFRAALAAEERHLEMVRGWVQSGSFEMAGIDLPAQAARTRSTKATGAMTKTPAITRKAKP